MKGLSIKRVLCGHKPHKHDIGSPKHVSQHRKAKKHGLKFVIKEKKAFLSDNNHDYVNEKIYRTTALAMRCMIFGGDPVLGSPFYLAWPHRLRIKQATCVVHGFHKVLLRSGSSSGTLIDAPFMLLSSLVMSGMTSTSIRRKKMFRATVA